MLKIRFHGRGGQGMKTASRILGQAFFLSGYEVQDAPRYGAERRGAPIFAYVRADTKPIYERGVINDPDLVVVADDTLLNIKAAGVLAGVQTHTQFIIHSDDSAEQWQDRLALKNPITILPTHKKSSDVSDEAVIDFAFVSTRCAAAAAKFISSINEATLLEAIEIELSEYKPDIRKANCDVAQQTLNELTVEKPRCLSIENREPAEPEPPPNWVDLKLENSIDTTPAIHEPLTSVQINTGLWRTLRPVINDDQCNHCWWVCSTLCPDSAIAVENNTPKIDYDHCKGCLLCVAHCPPKAIHAKPEISFRNEANSAQEEASS